MDDFTIDRLAWHVANDPRGHEVAHDLALAYKPLVPWLLEHDLLANRALAECDITDEFEVRKSDLTPEGYELFRLAHDRWLRALDRIPIGELTEQQAARKVQSIWAKYLGRLRAEPQR